MHEYCHLKHIKNIYIQTCLRDQLWWYPTPKATIWFPLSHFTIVFVPLLSLLFVHVVGLSGQVLLYILFKMIYIKYLITLLV